MFSILILTIGIPASGKTTWVNEYRKSYPQAHVVSTDELRKEITGTKNCDPRQNDLIHDEARKRVKQILDDPNNYGGNNGMGPIIIVDSTNVDFVEWIKYKMLGASIMCAKVFDLSPTQAMERQKNRERKVPMEILQMKWDSFQKNKHHIQHIFNMIL